MSESDSFIQEVSEEVRRDRLNALVRRYGWIAALVVLLIVGGAAWNEWRKARIAAEAQAFGDAVLSALNSPDDDARARALSGSLGAEEAAPFLALLRAADQIGSDDAAAAAQTLQTLANDFSAERSYRDLAALKLVLMGDEGVDAETRANLLENLSQAGAPYRIIALEQKAIALAAAGETDAARNAAEDLLREPGLSQGMVQRVAQLMVILGPAASSDGEDG